MISRVSGKIIESTDKYVVLEVGGIGYQIFTTTNTLSAIQSSTLGTATLWTHMAVRENSIELFGFSEIEELRFFEMLIDISGIGPRSALSIIGIAPVETLKRAIGSGDLSYLTKISGIGKKTAEKIVIELRDKLSALGHKSESGEHKVELDALEALKSLGYTQNEARDALKEVGAEITDTSTRVKEALKILGRK